MMDSNNDNNSSNDNSEWNYSESDIAKKFMFFNVCPQRWQSSCRQLLPRDMKVEGMILIHPFFCEGEPMWMYMCPTNEGPRDHRLKPSTEDLARIGCDRVLVVVAGMDSKTLYDAGKNYVEELIKSGWKGAMVDTMVNKGKKHCFHLYDPLDPEAVAIWRRISSLIHYRGHVHGLIK